MINTSGIRLVKCPKCRKVLPEPKVAVYRCGGCNTILRAKLRTTNGETATTDSTKKISMDLSEKNSFNEALTVSASESSLLNNSSEKATEGKTLNSTEMQMRSSEKFHVSVSEKPERLRLENLNLNLNSNSNVTEDWLKEEHVEAGGNKEEPLKRNHASVPVHRINLDIDDRLNKHKVQKRKEVASTSSEEFRSAQNLILGSEKLVRHVPKDTAAYRKPPKSSILHLQADILSRVDKLKHELMELFGKVPEDRELYNLLHAQESSRYRRIRITPQENMPKPHQYHYHFQNPQLHKHGKRHQLVPKNHCRPILVGAPFVICSNCFELIQLPADFTVSTKRLRKLQCGSCSAVLLYSYRPQPSHSKDTTPLTSPESEMGTTPYNDPFPKGDPISISEEYGVSFGLSYSTDPDPGPPLHVSRNSSYSTMDGRSGRQTVGSRLHQIMGYESASEILFRQSSEISVRNDEISERQRKGKGILDEHSEVGLSQNRLKRFGHESPKRSGIPGFIKKGIVKLKPSMN
ncbi:hypothetical protein LUZ62_029572 [Rhynchospora pubera]|uniref:Zinc-ribbon domain-containing protein n=1 Tax=Rhynchospora pubera TaxID=906938 RepID=A0AAV8D6H6_9POAL|nr:hypothetical protein LUZ62_074675 [Rhynchospora pubera]KAJ4817006.1 hypothetical protein LUZ62_029572 [Rhynchospora pubera]